jgi:hypothetical protein
MIDYFHKVPIRLHDELQCGSPRSLGSIKSQEAAGRQADPQEVTYSLEIPISVNLRSLRRNLVKFLASMKAVNFLALCPPSALQEGQLNGHRNFTRPFALRKTCRCALA